MIDPRSFTAVSFDCYGTLVDWETGILDALTPMLERRGRPVTAAELLGLYARLESEVEAGPYLPYREVLRRVVTGFGRALDFVPTPEEVEALPESLASWPVFPDTVAALRRLAGRYRLAILSNVDDDLFAATAASLEVPFDAVVTAGLVGSYKPDERNFHALLSRLALPRERVLHAAQSLFHDHVPAQRLGFTTAWVNRPSRAPGGGATPPAHVRPDVTVPSLAALADLLGV
ncbi:MAG: haloacid dehalogenase type II [Thermoanaerobaculia bacterium]|nr:haloacid dehalogenase type II [Thermoanaerobaculia bacterium]